MPLQKFDVLVADPAYPDDTDHATTHRITVLHADRLVAERNATENGIPHDGTQSQGFTSLVIWNALRRTGVHNEPFQVFLPRLLDLDPVQPDESPEHLQGLADPTTAAPPEESPSDAPSSSPATGLASTGSPSEDPPGSTSTD